MPHCIYLTLRNSLTKSNPRPFLPVLPCGKIRGFGGAKRCCIAKDSFGCYKFGFDDAVMLIACGLHSSRIALVMGCIKI
jgi:hypothetical protein